MQERGLRQGEQEQGKTVVCESGESEWDVRVGCESVMQVWCESVVQEWEWVERVQCENEMRVAKRRSEKVG